MRRIKDPIEILGELEKDKSIMDVQQTALAIKLAEKYHNQFEDPFRQVVIDFMEEEYLSDDMYYGPKKGQSLEISEILIKFAHSIK